MADEGSGKLSRAEQLAEEIGEAYPDLRVISERGIIHVRGSFPILHEGQVLDRFQIAIDLLHDVAKAVPVVRETSGRIPWTPDRHVNSSGEACVLVPEEWMLRPQSDRTLRAFLDGPLRSFLLGQTRGGKWPQGERAHGRSGLLEAYGEMLGVRDADAIPKYLEYLVHKKIKGHWTCPCGSGRFLRACHVADIRKLQERIPRYVAKSALERLKSMPPPSR